jgi:TatD DNase family protein
VNQKTPSFPSLSGNRYLIDTHCHLDMDLYSEDLTDVIAQAVNHNVKKIVTIGVDVLSSQRAVKIAQKYEEVFAAIGVHPHDVDHLNDEDYTNLRTLYQKHQKQIVGYGEIGLDYVKMHSDPSNQRLHFAKQLDLARELHLPIIVHNREAETDTLQILQSQPPLSHGGIMHCFSGNCEFAKQIIDLGMMISIPGIVTFNNAKTLHEVVRNVPLEHIIIETDGPFLSPHPYRGKRNEPVNVLFTAAKIAELKKIDIDEVAYHTTFNAMNLFNLQ